MTPVLRKAYRFAQKVRQVVASPQGRLYLLLDSPMVRLIPAMARMAVALRRSPEYPQLMAFDLHLSAMTAGRQGQARLTSPMCRMAPSSLANPAELTSPVNPQRPSNPVKLTSLTNPQRPDKPTPMTPAQCQRTNKPGKAPELLIMVKEAASKQSP